MKDALKRNARIALIEHFHPRTDAERNLLCRIFKVEQPELVSLSAEKPSGYNDAIGRLTEVFNDSSGSSIWAKLKGAGFSIRESEGIYYAIDFNNHILVNLNESGFDITRFQRREQKRKETQNIPQPKQAKQPKKGSSIKPMRDPGASQGENREWEVGHKTRYDDIDDGTNQGVKI